MPRTRLSAKTDAAKDMAIRIKSQAYAIHGGLDGAARAAGMSIRRRKRTKSCSATRRASATTSTSILWTSWNTRAAMTA